MSRLEQDMERTPSADEIANELDLSLDDVYNSLINNQRHVSMDASLNTDESDDRSLYDTYKENEEGDPDRHLMTESLIQEVQNSLRMLAKRESEILRLYFGLDTNPPHTLEEIGMKFGLTRERVRQIKEKAIRRLKNSSRSSQLRPYLG
jgi:RNA polymerase primary sigma factor